MNHLPAVWILLLSNVLALAISSPIFAPQFLSGGTGRNIRHLPCVSLSTGETGVCMFAFTCVKSNGTHLGTCIDRFYFGSCCKLNEDVEVHPQDNTIEDASSGSSFTPPGNVPESNDIPIYLNRPEKKPEGVSSTFGLTALTTKIQPTTTTTTTRITTTPTTTRKPTTTTTSQRLVTKRPTFFSTPYTTTQPPIGLSTFQTLHDYSHTSVTSSPLTNRRPTTTARPTTISQKNPTTSSVVSTSHSESSSSSSTSAIRKPTVSSTRRPAPSSSTRPSTRRPPTSSETTSSTTGISSTTERTSTRFPPRNATTTRPTQTTNTRKPVQTGTKKPTSTSKRPVSTRRPTTESPTSTTSDRVKPLTSTQVTTTSFSGKPSASSPGRPSTSSSATTRPGTISGTNPSAEKPSTTPKPSSRPGSTSGRPGTTSGHPRPSSKPTKISTTTTQRPTTTRTTTRPPATSTQRIRPSGSSETSSPPFSSTHAKPSTLKPSTTASLKPKPTEKPLKPSKPSKPTKPVTTTQPTTTTTTTTTSTTQAETLHVTSFLVNETTLANEILPPKVPVPITTTETIVQTSQPPGLVTWSSSSDDDVTKAPLVISSTSQTTQQASTEPEWSPITTPDGWIMIQSPTTEKTQTSSEDSTRPETTKIPATSERPTSESATTERVTSARPTVPALLSTIATVTVATDLPVPIETINMSDYTQVCGRRLFPESRIVGGDHSSFGKWPWQISLRQWRTTAYLHKCGAALLNENWAITAAHCVEEVPASDLLLRIGEHDLAKEDEPYGFQERRVQIVASHPQFDPRTFEYDLALLRFYEPVLPFQPNLLPICLPDDDETYVGHTAYVTGWGRLYEEGPLPSVLQEVSVPVVNNSVCEGMYRNAGYNEHIPHIFICAGWRKGGFDSCEGDSGGPMVIQRPRDKRWILAGVISWGIGCAEPNQPGVYTRISEFREWINQILQF